MMSNGSASQLPFLNFDKFKTDENDQELAERLNAMRGEYMPVLDAMMDELVEKTGDLKAGKDVVQDFAMFTLFLASIKMTELSGIKLEPREILSAFNYLQKRGEREIPEQILNFVKSIQGRAEH